MKMLDLNCNSIHFYLFLVTLRITFMINVNSSTRLLSNPLQDAGCAMIDCGQGKCKASNTSLLGFDCECNPGWNKIQIGHLLFSPCVIPNCTVGFQCNVGSPPPAPLLSPPLLNLSDPCAYIWCGDGTCVTSGTGHSCKCFEGSTNLLNSTGLACFKQCYLGADCNTSVGLGPPAVAPPAPSLDTSESRKKGNARNTESASVLIFFRSDGLHCATCTIKRSAEMLHCSRILYAAIAITLLPLLMFVTSA